MTTAPAPAISNYQISYEGLNFVTQVAEIAPSGATQHATTFGYDADSNLVSRSHDCAPYSYAYDPRNLLSKETDAQSASDPAPQVTTFTYTPVGQLATEVKPNSNTVTDTYCPRAGGANPDGTATVIRCVRSDGRRVTTGHSAPGSRRRFAESLRHRHRNGTARRRWSFSAVQGPLFGSVQDSTALVKARWQVTPEYQQAGLRTGWN